MNYIDVVRMMKLASSAEEDMEKQRKKDQAIIDKANKKFTETTGKKPPISNEKAFSILHDPADVSARIDKERQERKERDKSYQEAAALAKSRLSNADRIRAAKKVLKAKGSNKSK